MADNLPPARGRGRPKGAKNKLPAEAKAILARAFEDAGGVEALTRFAMEQPQHFYSLWGRLIPKPVDVEHKGGVTVRLEYVDGDE